VGIISLIIAVILTACGGGDSKSESTTAVTKAPTTVAAPVTTTPATTPATVKATTTTAAANPDQYEIVTNPDSFQADGSYNQAVPDDGTYPLDALNTIAGSLTTRQFQALDDGASICTYGTEYGDVNSRKVGIAIYSPGGGIDPFLAIHVTDEFGEYYLSAAEFGLITHPDGSWSDQNVREGPCK